MHPSAEAAKRKKQVSLVAMLSIGLVIAIVTQPRPETSSTTHLNTTKVETLTTSLNSVSPASPESSASDTATSAERFKLRDLSRIEWEQMRTMTLFHPRPMDASVAGTPHATGESMRVEAIYGSTLIDSSPQDLTAKFSQEDTSRPIESRQSALIGRAIVRPGEALPDGRTVLRVTTEGVAVSP